MGNPAARTRISGYDLCNPGTENIIPKPKDGPKGGGMSKGIPPRPGRLLPKQTIGNGTFPNASAQREKLAKILDATRKPDRTKVTITVFPDFPF
jgi:hypothetical protein